MTQSENMILQSESLNFENILYSSEKHFKSFAKFTLYDDIGSLKLSPDSIEFVGKKSNLEISNIAEIKLSRQVPSLSSIILVFFVVSLLSFLLFLSIHNVAYIISLFITISAYYFVLYKRSWIMVTYSDMNSTNNVYFMEGSKEGFPAWGKRSEHFLSSIEQIIFT